METMSRLSLQPAIGARANQTFEGADQYITALQVKLGINPGQVSVWELFAESLRANRHRMQTLDDMTGQPFGAIDDRLAARDAMRRSATDLFEILDTAQQQTAAQVLPLCCLPYAAAHSANAAGAARGYRS